MGRQSMKRKKNRQRRSADGPGGASAAGHHKAEIITMFMWCFSAKGYGNRSQHRKINGDMNKQAWTNERQATSALCSGDNGIKNASEEKLSGTFCARITLARAHAQDIASCLRCRAYRRCAACIFAYRGRWCTRGSLSGVADGRQRLVVARERKTGSKDESISYLLKIESASRRKTFALATSAATRGTACALRLRAAPRVLLTMPALSGGCHGMVARKAHGDARCCGSDAGRTSAFICAYAVPRCRCAKHGISCAIAPQPLLGGRRPHPADLCPSWERPPCLLPARCHCLPGEALPLPVQTP